MQTLTTLAESERAADSKNVFWIAELVAPDGLRRFCSRPLALGAMRFEPRIIGVKSFVKEMDGNGRCGPARLILEISNEGGESVQEIAERHGVENLTIRMGVLFMDEIGNAAAADIIWLGDFKTCAAEFLPSLTRLVLVDPLTYFGARPLLRIKDSEPLPVILGRVERCPLRLISPTPQGLFERRLDGELTPEAITLRLNDASGLPPFGALQVGDEVLMYQEVDKASQTVGSMQSPLQRPNAGYHSNGAPVRFIPEGGLRFAAADHKCKSIENIRADNFPVDDAAIVIEEYEGREVSAARLEQWTCLVRHASGASQIVFDGSRSMGAWIAENEEELDAERAADEFFIATYAPLNENNSRLSLRFGENLSNGEKRFGILTRAFLETHYSASRPTASHAALKIGIKKGGVSQTSVLLFPERYFSADEGDSGSPVIAQRMDITDMALGGGGWEFFCGGEDAPIAEIELSGEGSDARIADVALVLEYRPRVSETILDNMMADVEGLCADGSLIRNPADAVRHLLTNPDFLGLPAEAIDDASFQSLRAELEAKGFFYDARIIRPQSIARAIENILSAADFRLAHEGKGFRFLPAMGHPSALGEMRSAAFDISSALILNEEPPLRIPSRDSSSLGEIQVRLPLSAIHLERGDRIRLSHAPSRLDEAFGEIARWSLAEPDCIEIGISLATAGTALWQHDTETLLWRQAYQPALIFYIRGRAVARLERCGDLVLLGEAWEGALDEEPLENPIEYDAAHGVIYFGAGGDGDYSALFAIDADGNLLTRREIWEHQNPPTIEPADYIQCLPFEGEDVLNVSLDLLTIIMTARRESAALRLTGEIIETKF